MQEQVQVKTETKLDDEIRSETNKDYAFDFEIPTATTEMTLSEKGNQKTQRSVKNNHGFKVNNKTGSYSGIYDYKLDGDIISEEEQEELKNKISETIKVLESGNKTELDFVGKVMSVNDNITSQVGSNYNRLNKEMAESMTIPKSSELNKELTELNKTMSQYRSFGYNDKFIYRMLNKIKMLSKSFSTLTIEERISEISDELIKHSQKQDQLYEESKQKIVNIISLSKEVGKSIYYCKEVLKVVEKRRVDMANELMNDDSSGNQMKINFYKELVEQERELEMLILNMMSVNTNLTILFNKNSDMRGTFRSLKRAINDTITFTIPDYRNLLIDFVQQLHIKEAAETVKLVRKTANGARRQSMKNYESNRLEANKLANEVVFDIESLRFAANVVMDTENKLRQENEKYRADHEKIATTLIEIDNQMKDYMFTKDTIKR